MTTETRNVARLVFYAAATELVGVGAVLLVAPSWLAWLIFGAPLPPQGEAVGRIAGIAAVSFSLASWPRSGLSVMSATVRALLVYNSGVAVYLVLIGLRGGLTGFLLWPAVVLHLVLTAGLVRVLSSKGG